MCRTLGALIQQMQTVTTPVTVAPTPEGPLSFSLDTPFASTSPLPPNAPPPEAVQEGIEDEDESGYFLFQIARKYNMAWAMKGDTPFAQSELGRPSAIRKLDKMFLAPGAGIDVISYVNSHLQVPALDTIPVDFRSLLVGAPRRRKPLSFSGFKPLPISKYTSEISSMASFLDEPMAGPIGSFLSKPQFPTGLNSSRFMILSALEGITALNVLHELPETATKEDREALSDHLGGIFYAILRKTSETFGNTIRSVRLTHLGGVTRATQDELVNQPILDDTLYTDDKKVGLAAQPPSKRPKFFNRKGTRGGWNPPAALGSPPGGFQPQGGHSTQSFGHKGGRSRPPSSRQGYRGGRGGRRGRR